MELYVRMLSQENASSGFERQLLPKTRNFIYCLNVQDISQKNRFFTQFYSLNYNWAVYSENDSEILAE